MEYEIGDDPQGLTDGPEADRDGGLPEDRMFFRKDALAKRSDRYGAADADFPIEQFGEAA